MKRAHGIDISQHQGSFDPTINPQDIQFVVVRAGNGTTKDRCFDEFVEAISPIPVRGAYHYFRSESSPVNPSKKFPWEEQARLFLEWTNGKGFHFFVLDFEQAFIQGVPDNQKSAQFAADAQRWMQYVADKSEKPVLLYTNPDKYLNWLKPYGNWMQNWPLWLAQYHKKPSRSRDPWLPPSVTEWKFWQYSADIPPNNKGQAYGVQSQNIDLNVYNGTVADLHAWLGLTTTAVSIDPKPNGHTKKIPYPPSQYSWKDMLIAIKSVAENHGERYAIWLQEAPAMAVIDNPEIANEPYAGPAIENWPLTTTNPTTNREAIRAEIIAQLQHTTERPLTTTPEFHFAAWPTAQRGVNQIFGVNPHNYPGFPGHEGIDIEAPFDSPYYAVAPGKVSRVRISREKKGYGTYVAIDHGNGYSTLYAHAHADGHLAPAVNVGDTVDAGDIIAYSGNTGNSSGPHLHLTLQKTDRTHPEPGWENKPLYKNPGPFLMTLLRKLEPAVNAGYLHRTHLQKREQQTATVKNPNGYLQSYVREQPDGNSRKLVGVPAGTVVEILDNQPKNGYLKCKLCSF